MKKGDTIVYKMSRGSYLFYWLVEERENEYLLFSWLGNPNESSFTDFWRMSKSFFENSKKQGKIAVFSHFPKRYEKVLARRAEEQNMGF